MNTPEKCPHCGAEVRKDYTNNERLFIYTCGTWSDAGQDRTDLCREREARQKAEAGLEKMKGEATREIMLRDKIEKRCEIAEAENQKLRELLEKIKWLLTDHEGNLIDCIHGPMSVELRSCLEKIPLQPNELP